MTELREYKDNFKKKTENSDEKTENFRQISVEGCEVIGRGGLATVYRLNEDKVVKLFDLGAPVSLDMIRREQDLSSKTYDYGIPTAKTYDIVKTGDFYGIVYEIIDAPTLGRYITDHPDLMEDYIRQMAELGRKMHTTVIEKGDFQDSKTIFLTKMTGSRPYMTKEQIAHYESLVEALPDGDTMVHGDFHPANIIVRDGRLVLIDMGDVSCGCPLIDLGSMYTMLYKQLSAHIDYVAALMEMDVNNVSLLWPTFLKYYFGQRLTIETKALLERAMDIIELLGSVTIAGIAHKSDADPGMLAWSDQVMAQLMALQPDEVSSSLEAALDALYR